MLHSILTKLGQNDQYLDRYSHTNNGGDKGRDGVTRVKKVIFTKIAISSYRLHGMVMWLMHINQLDTLYKSYRS